MTLLALFDIGFGEMVVVAFVALLLFGGRLPEVMRTLGTAYRNLRKGVDDLSRSAMRPDLSIPRYQPTPPVTQPPTPAPRAAALPPAPAPKVVSAPPPPRLPDDLPPV